MAARPLIPVLCVWLAATTPQRSTAAPIFTATPSGDWFDGASWSGTVAPGATDDPVIDNGATATASSDSPLYPGGPITVNSVTVGSRLDPARPVDASGEVALSDVDLAITGDLSIGAIAIEVGESTNTVTGSLAVEGGDHSAGDLRVDGETRIGAMEQGTTLGAVAGEGSTVSGALTVDGTLTTAHTLHVGVSTLAGGIASAQTQVGGDARIVATPPNPSVSVVYTDVRIGASLYGLAGPAGQTTTGSMSVARDMQAVYDTDQIPYDTTLLVGAAGASASVGNPSADGRLDVGRDLLGFFAIEVGYASSGDAPVGRGELHVAGKMIPAAVENQTSQMGVGISYGSGSAIGFATIGMVEDGESTGIGVGNVFGAGSAIGVLEIGSGDIAAVAAGLVYGDGTATGSLVTGGGVDGVYVGVSGNGFYDPLAPPIGKAVGSAVVGGHVDGAIVGTVAGDGNAVGYATVEGVGTFAQRNRVVVGSSTVGAGSAEGHLVVRSGGIFASQIAVGDLRSSAVSINPPTNATVTGLLETTGDVSSNSQTVFGGDVVGTASARSGGHADGTWILHDGIYTGRKLSVGVNLGSSEVSGTIHLDHMLIDVDSLILGGGAHVELEIDGILRGDEYSAIDAAIAALDGTLAVAFTSPAQVGVYDLLVSGGSDGITGAFYSVTVSGLGANQSAWWGIETVGDVNSVEVFRLYVVPEPGTGVLLLLGLIGLRGRRTR